MTDKATPAKVRLTDGLGMEFGMTYKTEEEAIAAAKAEVDGFIDFDGQNCGDLDDNCCAGWDGESRRCDCGNRRVYWATTKCVDGTFFAYAEAY